MELHELKILQWQACAGNHSITIARARMRAGATEVRPPITTSCEYCLVRTESVESTIFHVERNYADTLAVLHYEIERKVFDEKVGIVAQGLAIEGV
jgi:hypothetical protein